jgi:hypothetical protein
MTSGSNCERWSGQGATVTVFVLLGLWAFSAVLVFIVEVCAACVGLAVWCETFVLVGFFVPVVGCAYGSGCLRVCRVGSAALVGVRLGILWVSV